jgi:hypothetical protein
LSEYVKLAFELRAAGKSYAEITKATKGKLYTAAGSWVTFFKNKSYLGIYGKREIQDHHEPLIPSELWEAVQRVNRSHRLKRGGGYHPRRVGNPSLLTSFTYCLECGAMMTHSPGGSGRPWKHYLCGMKNRHGNQACNSRRVGAVKAEAKVIEILDTKILTPAYLAEGIEAARQRLESSTDIEREITAERRRLEDLEIKIQRLLRTIEKTDSPAAAERLTQREAEREQAKANVDGLSLQLAAAQIEITPAACDVILAAWREQFHNLQEADNARDLRAFIMQFIRRIELGYNQAKIFYTYPMSKNQNYTVESPSLGALFKVHDSLIVVEWS